jgi:hypothetical protein
MADSPLAVWLKQQDQTTDPEQPPGDLPLNWGLEEPSNRPRPRRFLLVLAVVPWVIALALGAALLGSEARAPAPADAGESAPARTPAEPAAAEPPSRTPVAEDDGGLAETGALVVRAALSGSQGSSRYVDAAIPTAVEAVGAASVVSVLALVLEGGDRGWERAALERYAVALEPGAAGPLVRAGPWALPPPPPPSPSPPALAPSPDAVDTDPALSGQVAVALETAGYRDVTVKEVTRDRALPGVLLARVTAVPPGHDTPGELTALLADTPSPELLGETGG